MNNERILDILDKAHDLTVSSNMWYTQDNSDGDTGRLLFCEGKSLFTFDMLGNRIGYGGGFYDKFLQAEPNHPTLALCYGFQVLPQLEAEEFDVPVDCVLWA